MTDYEVGKRVNVQKAKGMEKATIIGVGKTSLKLVFDSGSGKPSNVPMDKCEKARGRAPSHVAELVSPYLSADLIPSAGKPERKEKPSKTTKPTKATKAKKVKAEKAPTKAKRVKKVREAEAEADEPVRKRKLRKPEAANPTRSIKRKKTRKIAKN